MTNVLFVLMTVLGIGFLIFIHEAGHYICARLAGVRVLVFSLGFGPRILGWTRGGTDYRISLVPLGGYVRVLGEDPNDRAYGDGLHSKSVAARVVFYSGGVVMNLLFAFIAFPIVFKAGVEFTAPVLGTVASGGPAWQAGLERGDRILEVDGKSMYSFENMEVEFALAGDREVSVLIERDGGTFEEHIRPRYDAGMGLFRIGAERPIEEVIRAEVAPGSLGAKLGIENESQLVSLNGTAVDLDSLRRFQAVTRYSDAPVVVEVRHADGSVQEFTVDPEWVELASREIGVLRSSRRVGSIRPGLRALADLGLEPDDHILRVDGRAFPGESFETFASGPDRLTMTVRRGDREVELAAAFSAAERASLDQHVGLSPDRIGVVVTPRPGSPAKAAGMLPGDRILAVDGRETPTWDDLRRAVQSGVAGVGKRFLVQRDDGDVEIAVTPATRASFPGFQIQLAQRKEEYHTETVGGAIEAGVVCSLDLIKQLYVTLKKLFTGEVAASNLVGIITISRTTYRIAQRGWELFLYFLALLSINLAVINLLPIPILDGGSVMFALIEGIKGSPVNPKLLNYSQIVGLVFIAALLLWVTYNDILRI